MKNSIFLLLIAIGLSLSGCWEYSDGEKIGTIIKLRRGGLFCKTWDATLVRGGFTDGSGVAGTTVSYFTVEDERLVEVVKMFMEHQTPVKVIYRSEVISFCRSDSDSTFLKSIEAVK